MVSVKLTASVGYLHSYFSASIIFALACHILFVPWTPIHGHGRLLKPAGRSSLWRFEEFAKYNPQTNFDDNQLYCGGIQAQYELNGGKCGVCGDPWNQPTPRENEDGGTYGKGIITGRYRPGQVAEVLVELTISHLGYFRLRLCERNDSAVQLTQECFNKHRIFFTDDSGEPLGSKYVVGDRTGFYSAMMIVPNVTCSKCVIQWQYKAGNTWGICKNGTMSRGCGHQETFRACADVAIQN